MQRRARCWPFRARIRRDPEFAAELRYCADKGIAHSQFLKWAPLDRAKVIAITIEDGLRCSLCGTAEWEWKKDRRAYEPQVQVCMGCFHRDMLGKETDANAPGQSVVLVSKEAATAARKAVEERRAAERRRMAELGMDEDEG